MSPESFVRRPTCFLDLDDVLCLNHPYGGHHLRSLGTQVFPFDFWGRLFDQTAKGVLLQVVEEFNPRFVLTTSWLRFLERGGFIQIFGRTGLTAVATGLHEHDDAPQLYGETRLDAVERWLDAYHQGENFVVIDDELSGSGLAGSSLDRTGRVVMCEVGKGLQPQQLELTRLALSNCIHLPETEMWKDKRRRQAADFQGLQTGELTSDDVNWFAGGVARNAKINGDLV